MFATSCSSQEQKINIFYVQHVSYITSSKKLPTKIYIFLFSTFFLCCIYFLSKVQINFESKFFAAVL